MPAIIINAPGFISPLNINQAKVAVYVKEDLSNATMLGLITYDKVPEAILSLEKNDCTAFAVTNSVILNLTPEAYIDITTYSSG